MSDRMEWARRHKMALGLGVVALLVLLICAPAFVTRIKHIKNHAISASFTLQDSTGKTVTDADFRGKWMVVYFGYTHCPDSCPTALNDIAVALNELGNHRTSVAPVFITVDPERDHGKNLQDYANTFDKGIVALSGTDAQIDAAEKAFHIYAAKQPSKDGEYLVDHSSIIYILDPDGDYAAMFTHESDPMRIAAKLKQLGV